eukprot:10145412-Lingulodinium_polyedra.AAC.1
MQGMVDIDPGKGPAESLWQYLKEHAKFEHYGNNCKMAEYMGWFKAAKAFLPNWTRTLFLT